MGIHDRDYYRDSGGSWFSTLTRHGQISTWLVVVNVIVFIAQIVTRDPYTVAEDPEYPYAGRNDVPGFKPNSGPVTEMLDLSCERVIHGQVWRLLTHAFLHSTDDFIHILMNMLLLWWFGRYIEG